MNEIREKIAKFLYEHEENTNFGTAEYLIAELIESNYIPKSDYEDIVQMLKEAEAQVSKLEKENERLKMKYNEDGVWVDKLIKEWMERRKITAPELSIEDLNKE
jgi:hypothetical protein